MRPNWKRLAAAAVVLTLAVPVWATEIEMKKKEEPKDAKQAAEPKDAAAAVPGQAKAEGDRPPMQKKPCPIDNSGFNTLEDMFGFLGAVDKLALQETQAAEQAEKQAEAGSAPTQGIEWRSVAAPAAAQPDPATEKKQEEPAKQD